jgi:hypothetical protein
MAVSSEGIPETSDQFRLPAADPVRWMLRIAQTLGATIQAFRLVS